jgi:hypothetical protein
VSALAEINMDYFTENMDLLRRAKLADVAQVDSWLRLTKRIDEKGGVHRCLEQIEKHESAVKNCRYCTNDLWLQRSMQMSQTQTLPGKFGKKKMNFKSPPVSNMALRLTQSMPPKSLLPPIDSPPQFESEAPSYVPFEAFEEEPLTATPVRASKASVSADEMLRQKMEGR